MRICLYLVLAIVVCASTLEALSPVNRPVEFIWNSFRPNYPRLVELSREIKNLPGISNLSGCKVEMEKLTSIFNELDKQVIPAIEHGLKTRDARHELSTQFQEMAYDLNCIIDELNQLVILFVVNGGHLNPEILGKLEWWWSNKNVYSMLFTSDLHLDEM